MFFNEPGLRAGLASSQLLAFQPASSRYDPCFSLTAYRDGLAIKILPLSQDEPIYLTDPSQLKFGDNHTALSLDGVDVVEAREVRLE